MKEILAASVACTLLAVATPASADPCADDVRSQAARELFGLQYELDRGQAPGEDTYVRLHARTTALEAFRSRADASECASRDRDFAGWLDAWHARYAAPLLTRAHETLNGMCAPLVHSFVRARREQLTASLERGALAQAQELAFKTGATLRGRALFQTCNPTRELVRELVQRELPGVLHQVKLPTVLDKVADAYFPSRQTWTEAAAGMKDAPGGVRDAVAGVAVEDNRSQLARDLSACSYHLRQARTLSAADDTAIVHSDTGASVTVGQAEAWCTKAADDLDDFAAAADRLWTAHQNAVRKRWEYLNIKGWPMRKVYDERGMPTRVVSDNRTVLWMYEDRPCAVVEFNTSGKLRQVKLRACKEIAGR